MARIAADPRRGCRSVPGTTVNRFCSSGLQAIAMAAHEILHEGVDVAIGGGVESITPARQGNRDGQSLGQGANRASTWSWATRPRSWPSGTRSAARSRTSTPCRARSGRPGRSRRASSTKSWPRCDVHAGHPRQEDRQVVGTRRRCQPATSATGPTRRWKGCCRSSLISTKERARGP